MYRYARQTDTSQAPRPPSSRDRPITSAQTNIPGGSGKPPRYMGVVGLTSAGGEQIYFCSRLRTLGGLPSTFGGTWPLFQFFVRSQ